MTPFHIIWFTFIVMRTAVYLIIENMLITGTLEIRAPAFRYNHLIMIIFVNFNLKNNGYNRFVKP